MDLTIEIVYSRRQKSRVNIHVDSVLCIWYLYIALFVLVFRFTFVKLWHGVAFSIPRVMHSLRHLTFGPDFGSDDDDDWQFGAIVIGGVQTWW